MRNQNNEKIGTNKWTRLLIFDDTIKYYFLNLFKFLSSFNNLKINNSEDVSTLKYDFERRLCAQTQDLQFFKKFYMSQMNPSEFVPNTAYSVQLPYIAGLSL